MSANTGKAKVRNPISKVRKIYIARLIGRCFILLGCVLLFWLKPEELDVIKGFQFLEKISVLHLLWLVWIADMICQLIPTGKYISLGSHKLFKGRFKPIRDRINYQALRQYIISTTKSAYKVFLLWTVLIAAIGILYWLGVLNDAVLFLISVVFYVCDLICVLIWCPFRLIMKNRCCTTCRIFNWDHMMMFTPMLFVKGFFSYSLLLFAFAVWLVWELCVMLYPERFWEQTNTALRCSECTDKLCTQYCRKLRR